MSKTCVITGASRGIGRAIAITLSRREDIENIILISRTKEGLEETRSMMEEKHIECYAMDLTDYQEVEKVISSVGTRFGTIDYLLNVAHRPGEIQYTKIPYSDNSSDRVCDILIIAALDEAYASHPGRAVLPAVEATFKIFPPVLFINFTTSFVI